MAQQAGYTNGDTEVVDNNQNYNNGQNYNKAQNYNQNYNIDSNNQMNAIYYNKSTTKLYCC